MSKRERYRDLVGYFTTHFPQVTTGLHHFFVKSLEESKLPFAQ